MSSFHLTLKVVKDLNRACLVAQTVTNPLAMKKTRVQSLGWEYSLQKGMATHSSILAWRIPWTEEPGGLQSKESQGPDTIESLSTHTHTRTLTQIWKQGQTQASVPSLRTPVPESLTHRLRMMWFWHWDKKMGLFISQVRIWTCEGSVIFSSYCSLIKSTAAYSLEDAHPRILWWIQLYQEVTKSGLKRCRRIITAGNTSLQTVSYWPTVRANSEWTFCCFPVAQGL